MKRGDALFFNGHLIHGSCSGEREREREKKREREAERWGGGGRETETETDRQTESNTSTFSSEKSIITFSVANICTLYSSASHPLSHPMVHPTVPAPEYGEPCVTNMVYNPFLSLPPSFLPSCSPEYGGPRPVFTAHYANAWSKLPWMGVRFLPIPLNIYSHPIE
jgi:hypothetical protein